MIFQEVNLVGVKVNAGHGFYPQEQLMGNIFLVDIYTKFVPMDANDTEKLDKTVNYEILHCVIQDVMSRNQSLLETLVHEMLETLLDSFPFLMELTVKVKKLNPPMGAEISYSEVVKSFIKS